MIHRLVQWLLQNRVLQHILFWSLSFYILLRFFAYEATISRADLVYTMLFHLSLMVAVYINLLLLIPLLLKQGKYLLYILFFTLIIPIGIWLNEFTFNYLTDYIFPDYYFISYYEWRELTQFMLIYLASTTLLKLSKAWFWVNEAELRLKQLQSEKLDAELRALKSQIDPHFLFNSLNNLYALALDGDVRTPEAILKLSHNMRYMLYECNAPVVTLEKELEYIHNYLDLQRLRTNGSRKINFKNTVKNTQLQLAPLLFIPFVENAFKHGNGNPIDMMLDIKEETLHFHVKNEKREKQPEILIQEAGIGLQNIQRRLELLYPNRHLLTITEEENNFNIYLQITFQ